MSVELKNSIQHVGAAIANSDDCAATLIEHLIKCDYECDYSLLYQTLVCITQK